MNLLTPSINLTRVMVVSSDWQRRRLRWDRYDRVPSSSRTQRRAYKWDQDEVAQYLKEIVPPVLACFTDQDARVRYYACESMYNIAKVAKGEILLFFNDVFDSLCKVHISKFDMKWHELTTS